MKWLVIYQKRGEERRVEVQADCERSAISAADNLLRKWGENPASYKRPSYGFNKHNTVRQIAD